MIAQLQRAFERIDELTPAEQEEIAERVEGFLESLNVPAGSLAGSMPDLPDNLEDTLLAWRRESQPTPPLEDQFRWAEEE